VKVKEIIRVKGSTLYTAQPDQPLSSAIEQMAQLDAGSLLVLSDGAMVGMLTFREVLQAISHKNGNAEGFTVADVMVKDPITVAPDMEANDLRRLMIEQHMRYLPVIEDGEILGVISLLDVAKAVLEEQGLENLMLKNYIKNWPSEQ
jgi:CBS domain-containing protein